MVSSRNRKKQSIRVFRSLLVLSILESVLWSLCLFYSANSLGTAYFERETVNLRSTTGRTLPVPAPVVDARALLLAERDEGKARQRSLALPSQPERDEPIVSLVLKRTLKAFQVPPCAAATPSASGLF